MQWEVRRRFKRDRTYVYLGLMHVEIWYILIQYCKVVILKLKINKSSFIKKYVHAPQEISLFGVQLPGIIKEYYSFNWSFFPPSLIPLNFTFAKSIFYVSV